MFTRITKWKRCLTWYVYFGVQSITLVYFSFANIIMRRCKYQVNCYQAGKPLLDHNIVLGNEFLTYASKLFYESLSVCHWRIRKTI